MSFSFSPGSLHGPHVHVGNYQEVTGRVFDWGVTQQLLRYLRPHKRSMFLGLVLMLASAGLTLLVPYLVKTTIDVHITKGNLHGLVLLSLGMLAAHALTFFITWNRTIALSHVGNDVLRTMRGELFRHYQILSMSYYDKYGVTRHPEHAQ